MMLIQKVEIPEYLLKACSNYFNGSTDWFTINHPALNYASPWRYLKETGDIATVEKVLSYDISL